MPYLEQSNLYNQIDLNIGWSNYPVISRFRVPVYVCPSDPKGDLLRDTGVTGSTNGIFLYPTTYGFNFGTWFVYDPLTNRGGDGVTFPNARMTFGSVIDGTSHTLLAAEVHAWTSYTRNAGLVNVTFLDGSVRNISNSIDPAIWQTLGTRARGEPTQNPD